MRIVATGIATNEQSSRVWNLTVPGGRLHRAVSPFVEARRSLRKQNVETIATRSRRSKQASAACTVYSIAPPKKKALRISQACVRAVEASTCCPSLSNPPPFLPITSCCALRRKPQVVVSISMFFSCSVDLHSGRSSMCFRSSSFAGSMRLHETKLSVLALLASVVLQN